MTSIADLGAIPYFMLIPGDPFTIEVLANWALYPSPMRPKSSFASAETERLVIKKKIIQKRLRLVKKII
jgi:hypothetical protein